MKILGHEFRKMEGRDYDGFAGAAPDAYIWAGDDLVLIWEPSSGELIAIEEDGTEAIWKGKPR